MGWRPLPIRLDAIALRLEAIASRLETLASRFEVVVRTAVWFPSQVNSLVREVEDVKVRRHSE